MAGWTRGRCGVRTRQMAARNTGAKSDFIRRRQQETSGERALSSTVHNLPARPRMVPQVRTADDFRLADEQAAVAARCRSRSGLQDWPTIRELLRRTGLERVG